MPTVTWITPDRPAASLSFLLMEDFFYLLQEDDGRLIIDEFGWTDRTPVTDSWGDRIVVTNAWADRSVVPVTWA